MSNLIIDFGFDDLAAAADGVASGFSIDDEKDDRILRFKGAVDLFAFGVIEEFLFDGLVETIGFIEQSGGILFDQFLEFLFGDGDGFSQGVDLAGRVLFEPVVVGTVEDVGVHAAFAGGVLDVHGRAFA